MPFFRIFKNKIFDGQELNDDQVGQLIDLTKQTTELLRDWYIKKAEEKLTPQARLYAKHMGVRYNNILISDLKYRWGSCTPKNNLNFNWRLIKAPMRVTEYVVVHELAHLLEPNHTADFWAVVRSQLPDYLKSKEWPEARQQPT
jgi:predicted metal-dependent hydrolase